MGKIWDPDRGSTYIPIFMQQKNRLSQIYQILFFSKKVKVKLRGSWVDATKAFRISRGTLEMGSYYVDGKRLVGNPLFGSSGKWWFHSRCLLSQESQGSWWVFLNVYFDQMWILFGACQIGCFLVDLQDVLIVSNWVIGLHHRCFHVRWRRFLIKPPRFVVEI